MTIDEQYSKLIKPKLLTVINNKFSEEQLIEIDKLLKTNPDRFVINYGIMAIALQDDLVLLNHNQIKTFYNVDDISLLNKVDRLIANLITSLSIKLNVDVKTEFEKRFTLDNTQYELLYLIDLVNQLL